MIASFLVPKLEWLEAFAEFGADLNFTRAAKRLHLSQPALHAQVQKLGDALNVTLYERHGRSLVLTTAGVDTLRFARQMRDRSAQFVDAMAGREPTSPVVLAAGEGAFLYLLGPAIKAFVRKGVAPLRLLTRAAEPAIASVERGEAHLAVAVCTEPPEGLEAALLADVGHVAVLPAGHRLAGRRRMSLSALADEPLVVPAPGSRLRQTLSSILDVKVAVEATGWESMLHFAALGLGPAVVNGCCRIPRGLVAVPLSDLPRIRYYILSSPHALDDPRVAELYELLQP